MRMLLSSPLMWAFRFEEILPTARELGYAGVEVWAYHVQRTGEAPATIARLARDLGLELSVHTINWDLNITSAFPEVRQVSRDLTRRGVDLAVEMGAPLAVVHPGRMTVPGSSPEEYWPVLLDYVHELGVYARERGVTIGLEHMERLRHEFFMSPEDVQRAFRALNDVPVTPVFDTAHVPWQEDIIATYRRMPPVGHIHLSDATETAYHVPVGKGGRDLGRFLAYLQATGFDGMIAIEGMEARHTIDLARENAHAIQTLLKGGEAKN